MSGCSHSCSGGCRGTCGDACRCKTRRALYSSVNFVRVPGVFRRWEVEDLLAAGGDLQIEPGGTLDDGTPVYVVFRREGGQP